MSNEISVDIITHKLKIKGMCIKYITQKEAMFIFSQMVDGKRERIEIINPENLTYIAKYKSEIDLIPLEGEEKTMEDKIFSSGLNKDDKEKLRNILLDRKKEGKPITDGVLQNIILKFTNNEQ